MNKQQLTIRTSDKTLPIIEVGNSCYEISEKEVQQVIGALKKWERNYIHYNQ